VTLADGDQPDLDGPPDVDRGAPAGPLTGRSRLLRAGVLGSASMLLATGAHLMGGGAVPSAGLLAVAAFLVGLVAVTATSRRCRLRLLLPLLAVEQAVLHLVFNAADAGTACLLAATHAGHAATSGGGCLPADPMTMAPPSPAMWVSHLVATVLTAWLLTRGEAVLWALAERLVRLATAVPGARPSRRRPVLVTPALPTLAAVLLGRAAARAPPALGAPG